MTRGRACALALVVVVLVASIASADVLGLLPIKPPGIYVSVVPAGIRESALRSAYMIVQVSMMIPDGPMKVVYRGMMVGAKLYIPYSKVAGIVSKWVDVGNVVPGMLIDCWIVDACGKLVASGTVMVSYDPVRLERTKVLSIRVDVPVSREAPNESLTPSSGAEARIEKPGSYTWFEWRRVLYVAPENYTGGYYIKLPIVILYNSIYSTTNLEVDVDSFGARFTAVMIEGFNLESEVKTHSMSHIIPRLTYRIIGNSSIVAMKVFGGRYFVVPSGKIGYVWVLARPVAEYQREWRCVTNATNYTTCQLTGEERVVEYVSGLKAYASGRAVMGAVVDYPQEIAWPVRGFSEELEEFLSHVDLKKIVIRGDPELGDGRLDYKDSFPLGLLFVKIARHNLDVELLIPAGATLAAILKAVGGDRYGWLVPVMAAFSPTMTYVVDDISFFGGMIVNEGYGSVVLYVGTPRLRYESCFQGVHMLVLYFEAVPS